MDPLYKAIEAHWREHHPDMVKALERKGLLLRTVEDAARRTSEAEASLIQQGVAPMQAQELIREYWAFPPGEKL